MKKTNARSRYKERYIVNAKFWLEPKIELAANNGLKKYELNEIKQIINDNESDLKTKWRQHLG